MTKRIATCGILITLALIFGYVESLMPISLGIPGVKLGLANIVILFGLYRLKLPDLLLLLVLRVLLSGLLFGNLMSLLYSLAGGLLSLAVMLLLKKTNRFSIIGISMAGGVFHNVGQIIAAFFTTKISVLFYYLPILMLVGLATGLIIGIIASYVLRILQKAKL